MSFLAKYKGECSEGDRIEVGDEVEYASDRSLSHVQCQGTEAPASRRERKCPKCFMLHAGECF